ncbi:hypothetical protein ENBRE01_2196 [Enteropsectra breve]|nr:hypothetical protein ENBRE01_2196 [Enteropsectra breve]
MFPTDDEHAIKKLFKTDMATTTKAIGEFAGEDKDNVEERIKSVEVIGRLMAYPEENILKIADLAMRGQAKIWAISTLARDDEVPMWGNFKIELRQRFVSQKKTSEILTAFFSSKQAKTYDEYSKLLKNAKTILERGSINLEPLMKQVIAKSPPEMKGILLQGVMEGCDWNKFLSIAENLAWIAFPEKISNVNAIEQEVQEVDALRMTRKGPWSNNNQQRKYCRLHGEVGHTTGECEVIKLIETKGWYRKQNKSIRRMSMDYEDEQEPKGYQEDFNKRFTSYISVFSCCRNDNPFVVEMLVGNKRIKSLVDTEADISVINLKMLTGNEDIEKCKMRIKSACGSFLKVIGKTKPMEARIGNLKIEYSPIVVEEGVEDYAIIGADVIKRNLSILENFKENIGRNERNMKIRCIKAIETKNQFKDIFKTEIDEMTACVVGEHRIPLIENTRPIVERNFQIPKNLEDEVDKEIKKNLKNGIITESKSEWASKIIPVPKKDGKVRVCIDYKNLNDVTIKDRYPIPRIDEILDELAKGKVFSSLDATIGYYQIKLSPSDRDKTAFRWSGGFYEFTRMPFGLCNAPATFQRIMDNVLREVSWKFVIPYLDDIIIYSETEKEHEEHLRIVFEKLKEAGISLNENKCKLFKDQISILGNLVSGGTVKPEPEKIKALRNFQRPQNINELRSFLGLLNYCRGFIPNLAEKTKPLNDMLKGTPKRSKKVIEWDEQNSKLITELKQILNENTKRSQPNFTRPFILTTDASEHAIGGILSQTMKKGTSR